MQRCFEDHEAIEVIAVVYVTAQDNAGIGNIVPAAANLLKAVVPGEVIYPTTHFLDR